MGILTLTATASQAGNGGEPFPITSFFVCQGINGKASGLNVDVESSPLGVNPQNVKLGNGLLACVVAKLFQAGTSTEIPPPAEGQSSDGLKCYALSGPKPPIAPISNSFNITDLLFPGGVENGVPATKVLYVCSPAQFSPVP
jgi:hypothetical protein